jgi:hypothetical protein
LNDSLQFGVFSVQNQTKETIMKLPTLLFVAASTLALQITPAVADTFTASTIKTLPSQGDVVPIAGATAQPATGSDRLFVGYDTTRIGGG